MPPPPIVIDAHEDVLQKIVDYGTDLGPDSGNQGDIPKWKAGGINVVWFSIWIDPRKYPGAAAIERAMTLIKALQKQVEKFPTMLQACDTAADVRAATAEGKIAALIGVEGGAAINNKIEMLETYRRLGARYMTLTWRGNLKWAGSSQGENPSMGLTEFGRDIVREMNRLGIIVDLSHVSDQTFYDAIAVSSKPVVVSHSNARAIANHPRNISDDMLRALAKNGGVIGINFNGEFLRDQKTGRLIPGASRPTMESILKQIDHVVQVAGIDHVGFGSDWDGGIKPPPGLTTAAGMLLIIEALRKRGYNEEQLRKICGENFLRVLEANDTPLLSAATSPPVH